jgi:hypothetical protein
VGTGLSLVAFVVAAVLYAYRARLTARARIIQSAPAAERLKAIEATAEFFNVDVSGLSPKQKQEIVMAQIQLRARRELLFAGVSLGIAILLAIVAIVTILGNRTSASTPQGGPVTVREASINVANSAPTQDPLPVRFVVVVTGTNSRIKCDGEGNGQRLSGQTVDLSSKGGPNPDIFVETGEQAKHLELKSSVPRNEMNPTVLNFRLHCEGSGDTPWTPVKVTVENETRPPQPPRPTQSYIVCMGNGGGASCNAGANASYTCAQYRGIGGGAQTTYDTLAKRFCEYRDGDKTVLAPNKVIHNFSREGGECGWTGFTVVCNP